MKNLAIIEDIIVRLNEELYYHRGFIVRLNEELNYHRGHHSNAE